MSNRSWDSRDSVILKAVNNSHRPSIVATSKQPCRISRWANDHHLRWAHRRPAARWWAVQLRASCALDARSTVAAHALRLPGAFSPARMLPCRAVSPSSRPSECLERAKIMGTSNVHVDDVLYSHACSVTPAHPSVSTSRERANVQSLAKHQNAFTHHRSDVSM